MLVRMATLAPYKRPSIGSWLLPTMTGPWLAMVTAVGTYALVGPLHDLVPRWLFFVVGILVGSLWAFLWAVVAGLVDVALLATKMRALPNGKNGWLSSFVAPLVALASYAVYSPHKWYKFGPWAIVIALVVPLVVSAIVGRVAMGKKL